MQIAAAIKELEDKFSDEVPELVWATGAISYEYHFSSRDLFDALVQGSWHKNGTLFAADTTKLAIEDGELMGLVIGMPGTEFESRKNTLGPVWQRLVEKNQVNPQDIAGVVKRSEDRKLAQPSYPCEYLLYLRNLRKDLVPWQNSGLPLNGECDQHSS